jgi:hypothetical protein
MNTKDTTTLLEENRILRAAQKACEGCDAITLGELRDGLHNIRRCLDCSQPIDMPGAIYAIDVLLRKLPTPESPVPMIHWKRTEKPDGLFAENYVGKNTATGDVWSLKI